MRTILLLFVIAGLSATCKKQSDDKDQDLEGRWFKIETLQSPGNLGTWEKYTGPYAFLTIKKNGEVEHEGAFVIGDHYNRYNLHGKYITFYKEATTDSLQMTYRFEKGHLIISPYCYEPCGIKLQRVKVIL